MRCFLLPAALCGLALAGCSIRDAHSAAVARSALIGTSQADLDMCAGLPAKTDRIDATTEIRSYENKPSESQGVNVTVPGFGGLSFGSGGYCDATFKMVRGRVAEVRYAGDSDAGPGGRDAICAPIINHCIENPPATSRAAAR
jgi:hypothetical protein